MKEKHENPTIDDLLTIDMSAIPLPNDKIGECTYFLDLASHERELDKFRWIVSAFLNGVYSYFEIKALNAHEAYTDPESAEPIPDDDALVIMREYIRIVQQKNNPSFVKTAGLSELTAAFYALRRQNTHHYPLSIMLAGASPPEDFQFGYQPGKGIPALRFCRSIMAVINEIETKLRGRAL